MNTTKRIRTVCLLGSLAVAACATNLQASVPVCINSGAYPVPDLDITRSQMKFYQGVTR